MKRSAIAGLLLSAASLSAQVPAVRHKPLVSTREAAIVGAAAGGAATLLGFDQRIAAWTQQPGLHRRALFGNAMTGARLFGDPGTIVLGAALWAGGALTHDQTTATDGLRSLEAVALSGSVTWLVKGMAGRARPFVNPADAHNFRLGRGFSPSADDYQSFPSGHSTAAFAFASAITAREAERSPGRARWLGPLLYGAATLTGFSRMYDNKHWASDVLLGAGIGTASGLFVVRFLDRAIAQP